MAQWLSKFPGSSHRSVVENAEKLLRHAVEVFSQEFDPEIRRKKAKNVRGLAKRLLRARMQLLKAQIDHRATQRGDQIPTKTRESASLKQQLASIEEAGLTPILEEFSASDAAE